MELRPLYIVRFHYPDGWEVDLTGPGGTEEHHYYFAEGRCDGKVAGRFRAGNHPRRRTDRTFAMDMQGFIETDDGALLMIDYKGYGRAYPPGRRQVVGAAWHVTSDDRYKSLNDTVCLINGEVRVPDVPGEVQQHQVELVFSVSEAVWEAPPP